MTGIFSSIILDMARRDLDEWLWQIGAELQRLSGEVSTGPPKPARRAAWEPRIDLAETADAFVIRAEIAGVRGEEIRIAYHAKKHSVTIRGVRNEESLTSEGHCGYLLLEIHYGEFEREIQLPKAPIDPRGIQATYRNGILVVLIPRADDAVGKPTVRKTITITQF